MIRYEVKTRNSRPRKSSAYLLRPAEKNRWRSHSRTRAIALTDQGRIETVEGIGPAGVDECTDVQYYGHRYYWTASHCRLCLSRALVSRPKRSKARHHSFRWTSSRTIKLQAGLDASEGRNGGYLIVIGAAHSSFVSRQCEQQLQDIDKQQTQRRHCRPSSFRNDSGTPSGAAL